jgi:hypothetical protein
MKPKTGDVVRVHFICRTLDGTLRETSFGDEPLQFTIGKGQVIHALEQAVVRMEPGELKRFTVRAQLAANHLPVGKDLFFDIQLMEGAPFNPSGEEYYDLINTLESMGSLDEAISSFSKTAQMSVLIAVPVFNRKRITQLSLAQTKRYRTSYCHLQVFNDHSTEFDNSFLLPYADEVIQLPGKMGIHKLRQYQFRKFLESDFDLIYMTDNDVLHDPHYIKVLTALYEMGNRRLPVCLYNTEFSGHESNILYNRNGIVIKRAAHGVSMLFNRNMARKIVSAMNKSGDTHEVISWDLRAVSYLDLPWIAPEMSYLEHYGAGGINNDDYERDRSLNPTPYLEKRRADILEYLTRGGGLEIRF